MLRKLHRSLQLPGLWDIGRSTVGSPRRFEAAGDGCRRFLLIPAYPG